MATASHVHAFPIISGGGTGSCRRDLGTVHVVPQEVPPLLAVMLHDHFPKTLTPQETTPPRQILILRQCIC